MKFVNVTLRCAYTYYLPMVMIYRENNDPNGRKRMWGLVGSVLANITESLGIEYELIEPPDGIHGGPLANGSYDGTMGSVKRHEADIASGPFPLTGNLFDNFLTFFPFMYMDLVFIGGFQKEYESLPGLSLLEFNSDVRLTYLISIIVFTCVSAIIFRRYRKKSVPEKNTCSPVSDSLLELYTITLGSGSIAEFSYLATRALYLSWSIGTFFLVCYFTSWVCASSAIKMPTPRINDVASLVKHRDIVPYILKGCSLLKEFRECPLPHYRELYRMVKENGGERIPSRQFDNENMVNVANGRGVIITDVYCMENHAWTCQTFKGFLYFARERIAQMQISWAADWDMDPAIVEEINRRVHWITQMAVPWMRSFDINPMIQDCLIRGQSKLEATFEALALFDVVSIFYLHLIFCGIAFFIFIGEIVRFRQSKQYFVKKGSSRSFSRLLPAPSIRSRSFF